MPTAYKGTQASEANDGRSRRAPWALAGLAALLLLLGIAAFMFLTPRQSAAAYSPDGRISFVRSVDSGKRRDLYVVNPDGSAQAQATQDIMVWTSSWSPDGRRIALQADVQGVSTVVRLDVGPDNKGVNAVQLTADAKGDSGLPAWSPDGKSLAFQSQREGGDYQVFVMDTDGNNKRRLSDGKGYAGQPAWSPDGKSIAFVQGDKQDARTKELYTSPSEGGAPKAITSLNKDLSHPVWSPDGKSLLYIQNNGDRSTGLWIISASGGSPRVLVNAGASASPEFSPAGDVVLYHSVSLTETAGSSLAGSDLFTVPVAGGTPHNLTIGSSEDYMPVWSPDGKKIAWASSAGGEHKIVVAGADGANPKPISQGAGDDYQPAWSAPVK